MVTYTYLLSNSYCNLGLTNIQPLRVPRQPEVSKWRRNGAIRNTAGLVVSTRAACFNTTLHSLKLIHWIL